MSIDIGIFHDAERLFNTVRWLTQARKKKRGKKSRGPTPAEINKDLAELDRLLWKNIDVATLRAIIIKEIYAPTPGTIPEKFVLPRMLRQACESTTIAKKFARLMIGCTMMHARPSDCPDNEETPEQFVALLFANASYKRLGVMDLNLPEPFGIISQLVKAAEKGDEEANTLLRLLLTSLIQFGYLPIAVAEGEFETVHEDFLFNARPGKTGKPCSFPFECPAKEAEVINELVKDIIAEGSKNTDTVAALMERAERIPASAYEAFLTTIWEMIVVETNYHIVLTQGRDKVAVRVETLNALGLHSFAFFREEKSGTDRFCPYPKIHVHFFWDYSGERHITEVTITSEGEILNYQNDSWPVALRKILWCIVFDAYAEIVLPKSKLGLNKTVSHGRATVTSRRKRHRTTGENVHVHSHFRKLAEGWTASNEQTEQCYAVTGHYPPAGKTFVSEFVRSPPGETSEPLKKTDAWTENNKNAAVLTYDDEGVASILDDVASFKR